MKHKNIVISCQAWIFIAQNILQKVSHIEKPVLYYNFCVKWTFLVSEKANENEPEP